MPDLTIFLSHLSGDEVFKQCWQYGKSFLSHLSGDEVSKFNIPLAA